LAGAELVAEKIFANSRSVGRLVRAKISVTTFIFDHQKLFVLHMARRVMSAAALAILPPVRNSISRIAWRASALVALDRRARVLRATSAPAQVRAASLAAAAAAAAAAFFLFILGVVFFFLTRVGARAHTHTVARGFACAAILAAVASRCRASRVGRGVGAKTRCICTSVANCGVGGQRSSPTWGSACVIARHASHPQGRRGVPGMSATRQLPPIGADLAPCSRGRGSSLARHFRPVRGQIVAQKFCDLLSRADVGGLVRRRSPPLAAAAHRRLPPPLTAATYRLFLWVFRSPGAMAEKRPRNLASGNHGGGGGGGGAVATGGGEQGALKRAR
jgi:uncharacterized membrane protein YgcG